MPTLYPAHKQQFMYAIINVELTRNIALKCVRERSMYGGVAIRGACSVSKSGAREVNYETGTRRVKYMRERGTSMANHDTGTTSIETKKIKSKSNHAGSITWRTRWELGTYTGRATEACQVI